MTVSLLFDFFFIHLTSKILAHLYLLSLSIFDNLVFSFWENTSDSQTFIEKLVKIMIKSWCENLKCQV